MTPFTGIVAVTGLNATDNPGPGVALIEALRSDPNFQGKVIGLAYDVLDPGLYLPGLLDAAFMIPYPSAGRAAIFDRLAYIKNKVGLDVLQPTLDSELPALLDQEHTLKAMGIHTFLPTREQYDRRTKARLAELADFGVRVPKAETVVDPAAFYTIHERFDFPIVVKGVFYGAEIVRSVDEAVAAFHKAAAQWGLPVIVQAFVPGEEYNVAAVGDGEGGVVGAVAMKKIMVTDKGKGWAGVTVVDEALNEMTRDVMAALKWRGPCEIEVLSDGEGKFHLLEINPRFPAWIDLSAGAGLNLPLMALKLAMGDAVTPRTDYKVGTAFVRVSRNLMVDIAQLGPMSTLGEVDHTLSPFSAEDTRNQA